MQGMGEAIGTDELKRWIDEGRELVLIDVLGKEAFEELRLPGAVNACVYEVGFLDQVQQVGAAKGSTIVVYGSSANSRDSADAAERLTAAGYTEVRRYVGGRADWQEAGHAFEGTGERWVPSPPVVIQDGVYGLDAEKSRIEWTGRNVGNDHDGTLRLLDGSLTIEGGALVDGAFEIDMKSILIGDMTGDMAQALVGHLEHQDFFHAAEFATARVALKSAAPLEGATPGTPNVACEAELILRGVAAPISFLASVAPKEAGVALQANFDFDRTGWGVDYGSGKLYEHLGMHLVNDLITVQVCIFAVPR